MKGKTMTALQLHEESKVHLLAIWDACKLLKIHRERIPVKRKDEVARLAYGLFLEWE